MKYVMYNPFANNKRGYDNALKLKELAPNEQYEFIDITKISDYPAFFEAIPDSDSIIFTGGDGTINRFVNALGDYQLKHELLYYPTGSGNDFMNDVKAYAENGMVVLNKYITDLPVVTVKGRDYKVLNGVGFGIDGYCCEEGDRIQSKSNKPVNYTAIAIKGMLGKYTPTTATVTVDGVTTVYKKAWLAPAMNGRFFGGGMMVTPEQDRLNSERLISGLVMRGASRLKTLIMFPKIFSGGHTKFKTVSMYTGHEIKVEFDSPRALQIDGETILGVKSYVMRAPSYFAGKEKKTELENV